MPTKFKDMALETWFMPHEDTIPGRTDWVDILMEKTGDTTAVEIEDAYGEQKRGQTFTIDPEETFCEPWEP